jgi:hypothetical protein
MALFRGAQYVYFIFATGGNGITSNDYPFWGHNTVLCHKRQNRNMTTLTKKHTVALKMVVFLHIIPTGLGSTYFPPPMGLSECLPCNMSI